MGGATIKNDVGGTFDSESDDKISLGAGVDKFINSGLFEKTTTTGNDNATIIQCNFVNYGTVSAQTGALWFEAAVTGAGVVQISGGASVQFNADVQGSVAFLGAGGTLQLASASLTIGAINGFGVGDAVQFASIFYSSDDFVTFVGNGSGTAGTVTIDDGSGVVIASFALNGAYLPSEFMLTSTDANTLAVVGVAGLAHSTGANFNGDGLSDILWRNASGDTETWFTNPAGGYSYANDGTATTDWQVAGTGDFNGDGKADILWRNTNGAAEIWETKASGGFNYLNAGTVATTWKIVG